ncbi:MAG: NYN domain-containing protein [Thermodesulfobacteriota bacterium]|nr:NYN domain-containing protein [Thermodesulfobacteriota bacterium]
MAVHIIIDGYNLIKRSPILSRFDQIGLQKARDELIKRLALYRRAKKHRVTVVFDGHREGGIRQERTKDKGIDIIFSKKGEQADSVIKKIAEAKKEQVLVVTSDNEVADFSKRRGAVIVSSEDFEMRMDISSSSEDSDFDNKPFVESIHTKKKGPSKRLKKSLRKSNIRIKKL